MKKNFIGVGMVLTISYILLSPFKAFAAENDYVRSINVACMKSTDGFSNCISFSDMAELKNDTEEEFSEVKGIIYGKKYKVIKKTNFYDGPGTEYAIAGTLYKGNYVTIKAISDGWGKFKYDGKNCYVSADCIEKAK